MFKHCLLTSLPRAIAMGGVSNHARTPTCAPYNIVFPPHLYDMGNPFSWDNHWLKLTFILRQNLKGIISEIPGTESQMHQLRFFFGTEAIQIPRQ